MSATKIIFVGILAVLLIFFVFVLALSVQASSEQPECPRTPTPTIEPTATSEPTPTPTVEPTLEPTEAPEVHAIYLPLLPVGCIQGWPWCSIPHTTK